VDVDPIEPLHFGLKAEVDDEVYAAVFAFEKDRHLHRLADSLP
jgi:hypothetical protein